MLSKRLHELCDRVPKCDVLLDVGCDHGIVAYEIMKSGKVKKILLSDISKNSLDKAKKLISEEFPNSEFFVSDGVKDVTCKFDFCVIAGMGGLEIAKILKEGIIENALLQPMNNIRFLRQRLLDLKYKIVSDEIIFDGKFYNMIVIKKGCDVLNERELIFGRSNIQNMREDFVDYLKTELEKSCAIAKNVPQGERHEQLVKYIENIEELLYDY